MPSSNSIVPSTALLIVSPLPKTMSLPVMVKSPLVVSVPAVISIWSSPKAMVVSVPPEALKVQVMADPDPQVVVPTSVESKPMVIDPEALVMSIPGSSLKVSKVKPLPLPIKRVPLAAEEASTPVPPRETLS